MENNIYEPQTDDLQKEKRKKASRKEEIITLFRIVGVFWNSGLFFSHHASCDHFEDHVIHIGRFRICQGCFFLYFGFNAAIFAWAFSNVILRISWRYNFIEALLIALILFTPTFLQIVGLIKRRFLKIISRTMLGIGSFFGFYAIFNLPVFLVWYIPFALFTYCSIWGLFTAWRNYKLPEHCSNCPQELGNCDGFRDLLANLRQIPNLEDSFPYFYRSIQPKENSED